MFGAVDVDVDVDVNIESDDTAGRSPSGSDVRTQVTFESDSTCRSILGVSDAASWDEICEAHTRLVSDMTPGSGADHRRVQLALSMLDEVNQAFATLRRQAVA